MLEALGLPAAGLCKVSKRIGRSGTSSTSVIRVSTASEKTRAQEALLTDHSPGLVLCFDWQSPQARPGKGALGAASPRIRRALASVARLRLPARGRRRRGAPSVAPCALSAGRAASAEPPRGLPRSGARSPPWAPPGAAGRGVRRRRGRGFHLGKGGASRCLRLSEGRWTASWRFRNELFGWAPFAWGKPTTCEQQRDKAISLGVSRSK